jgi:hypothetical protein
VAVDNFYRLIVTGPRRDVASFRRAVSRTVDRPAIGKLAGWREFLPISLESIGSRHPALSRVTADELDPFEISVWPTRVRSDRRAELRYQFQTRN